MTSDPKNLQRKAFVGVARSAVFLGVLLFLPAWSLRFWQAWLYLTVFCACLLNMNLYFLRHDPALVERRLQAGPRAEQEKAQKVIQAIGRALIAATCVTAGLDHRFQWSRVPVSLVVCGNLLLVLGFAVAFRVFRENTFTASTIKVEATQTVISTGPYALVRHPFYSGTLLMIAGTPLGLGSLWTFVPAALLMVVVITRLLEEERYLKINLSGYTAYCDKVRYRLVPAVW